LLLLDKWYNHSHMPMKRTKFANGKVFTHGMDGSEYLAGSTSKDPQWLHTCRRAPPGAVPHRSLDDAQLLCGGTAVGDALVVEEERHHDENEHLKGLDDAPRIARAQGP